MTHYDYGFRIYNPSIGKFLSVDPLTKDYPMLTPYQFASNSPIQAIDIDGLEGGIPTSAGTPAAGGMEAQDVLRPPRIIVNNPKPKIERVILIPDKDGNGVIAPESEAYAIVEGRKREYNAQVADNVRYGLITSIVYLYNQDPAFTFQMAKYDQLLLGVPGGVPAGKNSQVIPRPIKFSVSPTPPTTSMSNKPNLTRSQGFNLANEALKYEINNISKESRNQQKKVIMMISGVNIETGQVATVKKFEGPDNGTCAETMLVNVLGGDKSKILFSPPYRPRKGFYEVCERCQDMYPKEQFAPGTVFKEKEKEIKP